MGRLRNWIGAVVGAALLAGCSTAPAPKAVTPEPVAAAVEQYPGYRWSNGYADKARAAAVAAFGAVSHRPGDFQWVASVPASGDAEVVIDLKTQMMFVYRAEQLVGVSTISSGKKGRETQLGFWAVRLKQVKGYSRKYDNAPMPFMQMYDPKGLAFHAGALPGYPASHGCVRLPYKFAQRLYGLTKIGTKVIIEG